MDERKLKSAFSKVRDDMSGLGDDIAKLQMQVAQSVRDSTSGKSISDSDNNLSDNVKTLDVELNSVKKLVSTLSKVVEQNTSDVREMKSELCELRKDFGADELNENSNKDSINLVNNKLADFQELINGKLTLDIAELRLEFTEEIAKVFDNMAKGLGKVEIKAPKTTKKVSKSTKSEEILEEDEKMDLDL